MHSIGRVVSVTYDKLIFEVSDFKKLNYNFSGFTYIAKGVVDYVTIVDGMNQQFIYQVIKAEDKETILIKDENSKLDYKGRFECIPIGILKNGKIDFNLKFYPFLQNRVYLTSEEEKKILFSIENSQGSLDLGTIEGKYPARIELSNLFNHHSAILGNTGSGKSTTIRQIIFETLKQNTSNLHLHVFDVHDEYKFDLETNKKIENINVLNDYKINIEDLDLQDWINLVKPSDLVQLPMLQRALKLSDTIQQKKVSEKWLKCYIAYILYTHVQTDAVAKKTKIQHLLSNINILHKDEITQYGNFGTTSNGNLLEKEFKDSLIQTMKNEHENQIQYLFLQSNIESSDYKTSSFENLLKGLEYVFLLEECKGNSQARSYCGTLETRVKNIQDRYSTLLSGNNFNQQNKSEVNKAITIYSVSDLDDDLLLFFTSYLIKKIFDGSRKTSFEVRNINVFILEEAHRYISKSKEQSYFHEIERFNKIAREGRKFGCFLMLSSQRPSELSSTVLSQCNNYFIHRIKNNLDLDYMLKTIPYIDRNQLTRISYLPTGVSFLVGELFAIPVEVLVTQKDKKQVSTTPSIKYSS